MTKKTPLIVEPTVESTVDETIHVENKATRWRVHMPLDQWNRYGDAERDQWTVVEPE